MNSRDQRHARYLLNRCLLNRSLASGYWGAVVLALVAWGMPGDALVEGAEVLFERDIRPILRQHCFDCHGAQAELQGGLDLRLVRRMREGGVSGPALEPGNAADSYLMERIRLGEMPPKSRLSESEQRLIAQWIDEGAVTARPEPESLAPGLGITPEERAYWAFRPIVAPPLAVRPGSVARSVVDVSIEARFPEGMNFAPEASREVLIRRAYMSLLGLPPTMEEVDYWCQQSAPNWWERLLDWLLAHPHYGEHWARHWLDVVGYADSEGYNENDTPRPWAWKYRDWVTRALNADKPYDQFLHEQIAGDELAGPVEGDWTDRQIELLTATGYLRTAADGTGSGVDTVEARQQVVYDTLKIVGTSLLGLSLQCAQCHDHRYDPIPQTDYYALRAVFEPALDCIVWQYPSQRLVSLYTAQDRAAAARVEQEVQQASARRTELQDQLIADQLEKQLLRVPDAALRDPLRDAYRTPAEKRTEQQNQLLETYPFVRQLSPGSLYLYDAQQAEALKQLDKEIESIRQRKPPEEFIRVLSEPPGKVVETRLYHRGDYQQPRQLIAPARLSITEPDDRPREFPSDDPQLPTTGRRLAFARWLTEDDHPLVARVIVNRVWMHHMGRAIVPTPGDFGKLGSPPTHPELLDRLAIRFRQGGWSLKRLHQEIMMSHVWRQGNIEDAPPEIASQQIAWLARRPLQRLTAESIRDRMLAAAGQLRAVMYGPPQAVGEDETGQVIEPLPHARRSLYLEVRRSRPIAILQAFDAPVMQTNCEMRSASTSASQSLMLLNGEFILEQAGFVAERVLRESRPLSPAELSNDAIDALPEAVTSPTNMAILAGHVRRAWELCLSRRPTCHEWHTALAFLAQQQQMLEANPNLIAAARTQEQQAMTNLCHVLLSCNEFLYSE